MSAAFGACRGCYDEAASSAGEVALPVPLNWKVRYAVLEWNAERLEW